MAVREAGTPAWFAFTRRQGSMAQRRSGFSAIVLLVVTSCLWLALWSAVSVHATHLDVPKMRLVWYEQPGNSTGGYELEVQPVLAALKVTDDSNNGQVAEEFFTNGTFATAAIYQGSDPYAILESTNGTLTFEASNGLVYFDGLFIRRAGTYTIRITVPDVADAISDPFIVSVGPPESIEITQQPGTALGGSLMQPQPQVQVLDRGGNVVTSDSSTTVTVSLYSTPPGVNGVLSGTVFTTRMVDGTASFVDLSIDKAGYPYLLEFSSDSELIPNTTLSEPFTVAVGPTVDMVVLTEPNDTIAGVPFGVQPVVALVDAGGNINVADNTSTITVSLGVNPSNAVLYPKYLRRVAEGITVNATQGSEWVQASGYVGPFIIHGDLVEIGEVHEPVLVEERTYADVIVRWVLDDGSFRLRLHEPWPYADVVDGQLTRLRSGFTRPVSQGIVEFEELHIDRFGRDYTLVFTSSLYAAGILYPGFGKVGHGYGYGPNNGLNITTVSRPFNLTLGEPSWLRVETNISDAWAGGQPFGVQPRISVVDKGGNIMHHIPNHNMSAYLVENPSNATLFGRQTVDIVKGVGEFLDLGVSLRGAGYVMEFLSDFGNYTITDSFDVVFSSEFQVVNSDPYPDDFFGAAVDLAGDWAVIGAPLENREVREVQAISTSASTNVFVDEIQVVTSYSEHIPQTQRLIISAPTGINVTGYFQLYWNGTGPSRPIPADIFPDYLKVTIENDFEHTGEVEITRADNCNISSNASLISSCSSHAPATCMPTDCPDCPGCLNAFVWDITFTDLFGTPPLLSADGSLLIGNDTGADVIVPGSVSIDVVESVASTVLAGNFTLSINNRTTDPIPHNATAAEMAAAVEQLATGPVTVTRLGPTDVESFTWSVTFSADDSNYDVPQMIPDWTNLLGHEELVNVHTHRQGLAPLGGTFQFTFHGAGPSRAIPFNATAEEMLHGLQSIVSIDVVEVTRSGPSLDRGYTWTVTFIDTRTPTEEGFRMDGKHFEKAFLDGDPEETNLPGLVHYEVPYVWRGGHLPLTDGMLTGSGATVDVNFVYSNPTDPPWMPAVLGSEGSEAGSAYVFGRSGEEWIEIAKLRGDDTSDYNHFGHSVAIGHNMDPVIPITVAIGSPGAVDYGVPEIQAITCLADGGTIRFGFNNQVSPRVAFDATAAEIEEALVGTGGITAVSVDTTGNPSDSLCGSPASHTSFVSFVHPQIGNQSSLIPTGDPSEIEEFNSYVRISSDLLTLGGDRASSSISVVETQVGTAVSSGFNATGAQTGAVYVFEFDDVFMTFNQKHKLMPGSVPADREAGDDFGWSVSMDNSTLAVGAPGRNDIAPDCGSVFIYDYDFSSNTWQFVNQLIYVNGAAEDRFGSVVALHGATLAITAPNAAARQGEVYIYRRTPVVTVDVLFNLDQVFTADDPIPAAYTGQPFIQFGHSLAIHDETLLIGSPGSRNAANVTTGAVYVYDRLNEFYEFGLREKLIPRTAKEYSRAGHGVAVVNNTLLIASAENWTGTVSDLHPRHEVQLLRTTASPGAVIGNTFRLGFGRKFVPAVDGAAVRHSGIGIREPDGEWEYVMSGPIQTDVDEPTLRRHLEDELNTGRVMVHRFGPNQEQGYRWFITFMDHPDGADLPLLYADDVELTGDGAVATVTRISRASLPARGLVTVFTRDLTTSAGNVDAVWTEQAVLSPHAPQQADLFARAVAIDTNTAIVGAPNRDWFWSGINPGAAFFFDLGFLNVRFSSREYEVDENGGLLNITLERCFPECHVPPSAALSEYLDPEQIVMFTTADGDDWGVHAATGMPVPEEGYERSRSPAIGRFDCHAQSFEAHDCEWVGGDSHKYQLSAYDFRAVNDFAPVLEQVSMDDSSGSPSTRTMQVVITNDQIVENPDETFHLRLFSPGVEPSFGGDLWSRVLIYDDGDGGVGIRGYYEKAYLDEESSPRGARFGTASAMGLGGSVAIVSAPGADAGGFVGVGQVKTFTHLNGLWIADGILELPTMYTTDQAQFGASVALDRTTAATAVVGSPGIGKVSFFSRETNATDGLGIWTHLATLGPSFPYRGPIHAYHMFGGRHGVAVSGTIAAVGCRGWEAVFIFRDVVGDGSGWSQTTVLQSSDYRDLVWLSDLYVFEAHFGASVAMDGNTLLVGSPRANYGEIPEPAHFNEVLDVDRTIGNLGTGAVYVYELNETGSGNYTLFPYQVEDSAGGFWVEHITLLAPDRRPRDRFGESVAIHRSQVVVGAPSTPAMPETTWDFETGDLRGWFKTGTAFDYQPTYGDNPAFRNVYSTFFGPSSPQASLHRGRYWIGTFERRPGNATDFTAESPVPPGTVQGDAPQGTLTSHPFVIAGTRISFLVGGGCDERLEYVELLVDGDPTYRATGSCHEGMSRVHWDVHLHKGRSAQIRIVDASSAGWAHINVDDFRFDWAMQAYEESSGSGAVYLWRRKARGDTEEPCIAHPLQPAELDPVSYVPLDCDYQYQQRVVPNDKRPTTAFGRSLAVDELQGTLLVGAAQQSVVRPDWDLPGSVANVQLGVFGSEFSMRADGGINNGETDYAHYNVWQNGVNPYLRNIGSSRGGIYNSHFGDADASGDSMLFGGSGPAGSSGNRYAAAGGSSGINVNLPFDLGNPFVSSVLPMNRDTSAARTLGVRQTALAAFGGKGVDPSLAGNPAPTGVVYLFDRQPEIRDGKFRLLSPPVWQLQQDSQLAIASMGSGYRFGTSAAVNGHLALFGAPGDSLLYPESGSVSFVDLEYKYLSFAKTEYTIAEDFHLRRATILVERRGDLSGTLQVHYSTRDVTAFGVNETYHAECLKLPQFERNPAGCGDYTHTSGELYFYPQDYSAEITVDIMDDDCYEQELEYFVVQLSVPGGVGLLGEGYAAVVRIDDDDFGKGRSACLSPEG